jgi:hypothetical protein
LLLSLRALALLCQRSYWFRIWIVQEITVANNIVICCGNEFIERGVFFEILCMILGDTDLFGDGGCLYIKAIPDHESIAFRSHFVSAEGLQVWRNALQSRRVRFYECLLHHCHRDSTDPRDKVFGLIGFGNTDHYRI